MGEYPEFEKELKDTIKTLDNGEGANFFELEKVAVTKRWNENSMNEIIGEMIDNGEVFEPRLGYLKVNE